MSLLIRGMFVKSKEVPKMRHKDLDFRCFSLFISKSVFRYVKDIDQDSGL